MIELCMCGNLDCRSCHPENDGMDLVTHKFAVSITSTEDGINFVEESIRSLLKCIAAENNITWHEV